jgi:Na+/phosphate symporter
VVEPESRTGVIVAPRLFVDPEAVEAHDGGHPLAGSRGALRLATVGGVALRLAFVVAALALFVLALELLKAGASGLKPVLNGISADGVAGLLGFGWIGSYLVMSGSPVAAIALSLFSGGTISDVETFAMINGSRLGASFIVLFVGFLYYVTRRRDPDSLYIGVVALLTAFTLWAPVIPLGYLALREGWFDGVRFGSPGALVSFVDVVYDPITTRAKDALPELLLFAIGVPALLGAFYLFDRALPNLDRPGPTFERLSRMAQGRLAMFGFGSLVTLITLSVSLSLTILVPLTLKGYVRRQNLIPYIMGANITTWIDTLFASLLLNTPRAFTIVFTEMVMGAAISLFVLFFVYTPYSNAILSLAHRATSTRRGFAVFLGAFLVMPVALLVVS